VIVILILTFSLVNTIIYLKTVNYIKVPKRKSGITFTIQLFESTCAGGKGANDNLTNGSN